MPQMIGFQHFVQDQDGPLPGGYVVVFIMTKVPGRCLSPEWGLFDELAREKIRNSLILAIKYVYHQLIHTKPLFDTGLAIAGVVVLRKMIHPSGTYCTTMLPTRGKR